MSKEAVIRVFDLVGQLCISSEDGQIIHDKIAPFLKEGYKVILSFERVETLISAFLNAAIGQLYGEFSEEEIRSNFTVQDMSQEDLSLLKRVVENAKIYFKNPEQYKEVVQPLSEDEDEE